MAIAFFIGAIIGCATIAILGMGARSDLTRDLDRVSTDLATAQKSLSEAIADRDAANAELDGARKRAERLDAILADSRGIIADLEKQGGDGLALIDKCIILARRLEEGLRDTDKKP